MTRFFRILLSSVLIFSLAAPAASYAFEGSGTKDSPYLIGSKSDFIAINRALVDSGLQFAGKYFRLTADVDLSGTDFSGIGYGHRAKQYAFCGDFDGAGHAVHGLHVDGGSDVYPIGLFVLLGQEGHLHDLSVAADNSFSGNSYVAALVGTNYGTINRCRNYATVTGQAYTAGIAAVNDQGANISDCYNQGAIGAKSRCAGGIVGLNGGTIDSCQNNGTITAPECPAGISASNGGTMIASVISNINAGTVIGQTAAGGIVGECSTTGITLIGNINYGTVSCTQTSGQRGAISGKALNGSSVVSGNLYDGQVDPFGAAASAPGEGMRGALTRELLTRQGLYPAIEAFAQETAVGVMRQVVVRFADNDRCNDVTATAILHQAAGLSWTLKSGKAFAIVDSLLTLTVADSSVTLRDTLVASLNGYIKVIPLSYAPKAFVGQGTAENPYVISNVGDWERLAYLTNVEGHSFTGRHFAMTRDIDFGGETFSSVAMGVNSFDAEFDGRGRTLYNVNNVVEGKQQGLGVFGNVGRNAVIHDLTLGSGTLKAYANAGGIAGNVYGQVLRCTNRATVSTTSGEGAGGIAGTVRQGGAVRNCVNLGSVAPGKRGAGGIAYALENDAIIAYCENDSTIGGPKIDYVAGIASQSSGTIDHCTNRAPITGYYGVAGMVAQGLGGDSVLCCQNYGTITSQSFNASGILGGSKGSTQRGLLSKCDNHAPVISGGGSSGAIAGDMGNGYNVDSCYNVSPVTNSKGSYTGGLFGHIKVTDSIATDTITNCYNIAAVASGGTYAGGIVGNASAGVYFADCYNTGNVRLTGTTANYAGGFAGFFAATALRCFNAGNVTAAGYGLGGFAGFSALAPGVITQCFNLGDVTSTGGKMRVGVAGGLWGYGACSITDCYNLGIVSAPQGVGGLVGGVFTGSSIARSFCAGQVIVNNPDTVISAGNLVGVLKSDTEFDSNFFDSDVITLSQSQASDAGLSAKGVSTRILCSTDMGSAWTRRLGMYPTLTSFAGNALANFASATVVPDSAESLLDCRGHLTVGTPDSTIWTLSAGLEFAGANDVVATSTGEAMLTKHYGQLSRTYVVLISQLSGLSQILPDEQVAGCTYYDLHGHYLGTSKPTAPGIYIAVQRYAKGRPIARKMVVK